MQLQPRTRPLEPSLNALACTSCWLRARSFCRRKSESRVINSGCEFCSWLGGPFCCSGSPPTRVGMLHTVLACLNDLTGDLNFRRCDKKNEKRGRHIWFNSLHLQPERGRPAAGCEGDRIERGKLGAF